MVLLVVAPVVVVVAAPGTAVVVLVVVEAVRPVTRMRKARLELSAPLRAVTSKRTVTVVAAVFGPTFT